MRTYSNAPGLHHVLSPTTFLANAIPFYIPGFAIGMNRAFVEKYEST